MNHASPPVVPSREMEKLIAALDSLVDGEAAAERLVAMGPPAIPWLEHYLLDGLSRTIARPRCRAVHALGELGAQQVLLSYFRQHRHPADPAVLFAEDAVRSSAAEELAKHPSEEVYEVVLDAAQERITGGLIRALSDFGRAESVPVLFSALDDDLCREDARAALRKMPVQARAFAALVVRGRHAASVQMALSLHLRRATLQLLRELGADAEDWPVLREYLEDSDADSVIAAAGIGFALGAAADYPVIIDTLFRISSHLNWAQEDEVTRLLEGYPEQARAAADRLYARAAGRGEEANWLNSRWRILRHFLGDNAGTANS
jgi:hypothetical protein